MKIRLQTATGNVFQAYPRGSSFVATDHEERQTRLPRASDPLQAASELLKLMRGIYPHATVSRLEYFYDLGAPGFPQFKIREFTGSRQIHISAKIGYGWGEHNTRSQVFVERLLNSGLVARVEWQRNEPVLAVGLTPATAGHSEAHTDLLNLYS